MRDKLKSLSEAAAAVGPGARLVMSATIQRPPMAFLRALVRQGTDRLRVIGVTGGDINIDFLVGAGAVSVIDTCSVTLGEFARAGPNFARYVESGRVRAMDNTCGVIYSQAQAGAMGVPYVPVLGLVGTDLLERRDDMVIAPDPFDGKTLTVVAKAMRPDVAVFHVHKADRQGNVSCGYAVEAVMLAEASRHVIVTAEEIVDRLTEQEATGTFIPSILVDTVAHAPFGAHPAGLSGRYGADQAHMLRYVAAAHDDASFADYLKTHVYEVASHEDYVECFVPREWRLAARSAA